MFVLRVITAKCVMATLNRLFKIEFERGWTGKKPILPIKHEKHVLNHAKLLYNMTY